MQRRVCCLARFVAKPAPKSSGHPNCALGFLHHHSGPRAFNHCRSFTPELPVIVSPERRINIRNPACSPHLRASVAHLPPVQTQQNSNPLSTNSRKGSPSANPSTRQQPLFQMSGKACCRPRPGLAKDDAGGVRHFGRQRLGHALPNVGAGISGRCWVQFWNERRARPVCHFQVIPIHSPFEAGFRPCLNSSNALHHRLRRTSCPISSTHAGTPLATTDWSHP